MTRLPRLGIAGAGRRGLIACPLLFLSTAPLRPTTCFIGDHGGRLSSRLDLGERPRYPLTIPLPLPIGRYVSAARRAGSAWPRIIRRRVISRGVIRRRWVIGRWPVTHVVEGRRPREHSERRGDDCRGGNDYGARRADRPGQWSRRVGGIVLRLGGRERQSGEPGGERYRNRNSADTHGVSRLGPYAPRPANVVRRAKGRSLPGLVEVG